MSEFVGRVRTLALALGGPGLFLVALLDSSFLPLPGITDVLLVVTVARNPSAMLYYVAMTVAGSVAGCLALHYLGRKGGEALVRRKFTGEKIERAMAALQRNGVMAVLIPCLLPPPAPFKIFILLAGVVGISAARLATAIAIGRGVRYLALGITTLLLVQAFFNISVVLGLFPTKGFPLPMISYGGSSLLVTLALLGVLMNVSEHAG